MFSWFHAAEFPHVIYLFYFIIIIIILFFFLLFFFIYLFLFSFLDKKCDVKNFCSTKVLHTFSAKICTHLILCLREDLTNHWLRPRVQCRAPILNNLVRDSCAIHFQFLYIFCRTGTYTAVLGDHNRQQTEGTEQTISVANIIIVSQKPIDA